MRAEQYQRHLDAVTDYIYAHLDDDLSLETLAHVSGFSRYHWHRIYRAVRGETAAQAVRRLRLERAAAMLTETSWSIERIAWKAGFTGTEIFSRAFLRSYGTTPGRFRTGARRRPTHRRRAAVRARRRRRERRRDGRYAWRNGPAIDLPYPSTAVPIWISAGHSVGSKTVWGPGTRWSPSMRTIPTLFPRLICAQRLEPSSILARRSPTISSKGECQPAGTRSCATSARTLRCTMPTGGSTVGGCRARVRSRETIRSSRSTSPTRRLPRLSTLSPISSCRSCEVSELMVHVDGRQTPRCLPPIKIVLAHESR